MDKIITFSSDQFQPTEDELNEDSEDYINPNIFGKQLSDYLLSELAKIGCEVSFRCAEDWGWYHDIKHDSSYALGFGCQNYGDNSHVIQFHPKQAHVRKFFKKFHAEPQVIKLRDQIDQILSADGAIPGISVEAA